MQLSGELYKFQTFAEDNVAPIQPGCCNSGDEEPAFAKYLWEELFWKVANSNWTCKGSGLTEIH